MCLVYVCLIFKKANSVYKIMFYLMREEIHFIYCCLSFLINVPSLRAGPTGEKREEREGLSHQVGPTNLKVFTVLPLESIVCCSKIGPRRFQKVLFKNHIFNSIVQTTLNTNSWPNMCFFFLNTSVQCLNTEHWCLKSVTKRARRVCLVTLFEQ